MIDLHTHSRVSDGQYPPAQLVQKAGDEGIEVLALTDHDAIGGLDEAARAAADLHLAFIPGIELSAFVDDREVHLLGHFIDPEEPALKRFIHFLVEQRSLRMDRMIDRLQALGVPIARRDVEDFCGGESIGRTHLAQALQAKGAVSSFKEAFSSLIGSGKPAYVERFKVPSRQAIEMIRKAGGTATLAHPLAWDVTRDQVVQLKREGLAGLEVHHPDHTPQMRALAADWARELDLIPTAGSDFHGEQVIPDRSLGLCSAERASLDRLRRARARAPGS